MSHRWTLVVPRESAGSLARLRQFPQLAVHAAEDEIWLRGGEGDDNLDRQLRRVPGGRRMTVLADGQTIPAGKQVPLGYLPQGPWVPLAEWLRLTLPTAQRSQVQVSPVTLKLVPSGHVREPSLLETSLASWRKYLADAPQWRIDRWSFVACHEGQVLVRGTPLPPMAGRQWVLEEDIAVPAGTAWSPPLDVGTLRQVLKLTAGQIALLQPCGSCVRIEADQWVQASRSAARATSEVLPR